MYLVHVYILKDFYFLLVSAWTRKCPSLFALWHFLLFPAHCMFLSLGTGLWFADLWKRERNSLACALLMNWKGKRHWINLKCGSTLIYLRKICFVLQFRLIHQVTGKSFCLFFYFLSEFTTAVEFCCCSLVLIQYLILNLNLIA